MRLSGYKSVLKIASVLLLVAMVSCAVPQTPPPPTPTVEVPVQKPTEGFNWRSQAGKQIQVLFVQHPFTEAILPLIKDFTEKTGITVSFLVLPETEYWTKLGIDLASGTASYDVFMTGPSIEWQHALAGWIEPLDKYMNDPNLTSPEWDVNDFFPAFLAANRWNGKPGRGLGEGNQWAIPVMVETTIISYRKDIFNKLGLRPPETWEEWPKVAAALKGYVDENGQEIIPIIQRGAKDITSIQAGHYTFITTMGCKDFDENLNPLINTPPCVKAEELWVNTIKQYGPPDWTNITWFDMMQRFASGRYAMVIDNDFMAATYENPEKSMVAGKVGYALPPKGPDGSIKSNIWTWAVSMNAKSKNKEAAWLFIQWVTSKDTLLKSALYGNLDPVRKSVWEHPQVVEMTSRWDNGNWRAVVTQMLEKYAAWYPTPQTELVAVWDRWIQALHEAYFGQKTVQQALDDAAKDIEQILIKAGQKK